ncbi:MAG: 3-hydroxyisobutyrate dehydrogenase [Phenylobacterium sp.]|uniref:3-hydroxyisobutyrate dehydrogenase n=1 Tax=Phenylobacterium sp. TaxID=1871053 RepID=UPI002732DCAA|nr:3-hydroxyisobutyrate dehydrogenase [Phenylobacterium sp.]MDP3117709.1 3-hydroxyisobutyrate dehydrogenase [Phenylobacterium sp.]MDP3385335.1 3-hydroxyisobutyrate dehydrogenase [Phenylobacterium sp.]
MRQAKEAGMTSYALIGLGNMGGGMAAVLAASGHRVQAFDLSSQALAKAAEAGATPCASAVDSVTGAEVVLTMLPAGAHVREVYGEAILPHASADALLIDCSTIDVDSARAIARQAQSAGFAVADAPVSGGVAGAAAGTLTFMVGCAETDFPRIKAALSPMAKSVVRAGEAGSGQAAKICNNLLLAVSMIGVCEALTLAEGLGLDPERFFEIASTSSGQCWSLTSYCPWPGPVESAPSNRNYEGGFATAMMLKDLRLAQGAAASVGASTPLAAQAQALYALFDRLGYGERDFSGLLQLLRGRLDDLA